MSSQNDSNPPNPNYNNKLDQSSILDILKIFNNEDKNISICISKELENIQTAIDKILLKIKSGGRLIYIGAGTSGRLGVLDASECKPTFGCPDDMVMGIIAGSDIALKSAIEGAEDDTQQAVLDLKAINLNSNDSLVGISASGQTPYVLSAIQYANKVNALSIGLSCNKILELAQHHITPITGPEVILGSTRLKAGTACKMVLNMISSAVMIKLGHVYCNEMVDCQKTNQKLKKRSVNILSRLINVSFNQAQDLLNKADGNIKLATLSHKKSLNLNKAKQLLFKYDGNLRNALGED